MVKHIIWDFDGTLFDTYPAISIAFLGALKAFGFQYPLEKITGLSRRSMDYCINELCGQFAINREKYTDQFLAHYARLDPAIQPPFAGVREVCAFIMANGGRNFIVTHRGKAGGLEILAYYDMVGFFSDCIYNDDGFPKKPDPAAFNFLINKHHLKLEETLAVGDRDLDIEAGQLAGIMTCLFSSGGKIAHQSDITVSEYAALLASIKNK